MAVKKDNFELTYEKTTEFYILRSGTMFVKADDTNVSFTEDAKAAWELSTGAVRLPRAVRTLIFDNVPQPGIKARQIRDKFKESYGKDVVLMKCVRTSNVTSVYTLEES